MAASAILADAEVRLRHSHRLQQEVMPWTDMPVKKQRVRVEVNEIPVEKPKEGQCGPKCAYRCDQPECPKAECAPVCDPPECKTTCSADKDHWAQCQTRCLEPVCAEVCDGVKETCKTLCRPGPPLCTTSCAKSCRTLCAKPKCQWRCKATESCPAPTCKMECTDLDCPMALPVLNSTAPQQNKALPPDPVPPAPAPAPVNMQVDKPTKEVRVAPVPVAVAPAHAVAAPAVAPAPAPVAAPMAAPAAAPAAQVWGKRPLQQSWWDFLTR